MILFAKKRYDVLFTARGDEDVEETLNRRERAPHGWSKNVPDPMAFLGTFKYLKMKKGYVLRNYLFKAHHGCHSVLFALPEDEPSPEPEDCANERDGAWDAPVPEGTITDFMLMITGHGSPESFMSVSVFAREASSLGAFWHGVSWGSHTILFRNPFSQTEECDSDLDHDLNPKDWHWCGQRPKHWAPALELVEEIPTVTFYTYSGLCQESIQRHIDRFSKKSYRFETTTECLAEGPGGYLP